MANHMSAVDYVLSMDAVDIAHAAGLGSFVPESSTCPGMQFLTKSALELAETVDEELADGETLSDIPGSTWDKLIGDTAYNATQKGSTADAFQAFTDLRGWLHNAWYSETARMEIQVRTVLGTMVNELCDRIYRDLTR